MADEQANPETALAALQESRRDLESLTYTIAHDLRAPLRAIDGFAHALSEDCGERLDADGRRYLQHVLDASRRMSAMLDGLLTIGRVLRADLHPATLDIAATARGILERLQAAEPSRQLEVAVAERLTVEADPSMMTAALEALLQNAWKFTRGRQPARIEVGAQPSSPPVFYVRDNGAGFDMRYAGKLFAPFQRLHPEREFEGAGIGLATAHRILRRHGGRMWAEGAPDRGATFYFTLPASAEARAQ